MRTIPVDGPLPLMCKWRSDLVRKRQGTVPHTAGVREGVDPASVVSRKQGLAPALFDALDSGGQRAAPPGKIEIIRGGVHWRGRAIQDALALSLFLVGMPGLLAIVAHRTPQFPWLLLATGIGAVITALLFSVRLDTWVTRGEIRVEWHFLFGHLRRDLEARPEDIVLKYGGKGSRVKFYVSAFGKRLSSNDTKNKVEALQAVFRQALSGGAVPPRGGRDGS